MSGHSKWAKIKRDKGANDAKRGAVFTKLGNQIAIAARGGIDPTMNSALALAIERAKAANMPGTNIQRAIDRVADKNAAVMEEIAYEAYGPGGVGIQAGGGRRPAHSRGSFRTAPASPSASPIRRRGRAACRRHSSGTSGWCR